MFQYQGQWRHFDLVPGVYKSTVACRPTGNQPTVHVFNNLNAHPPPPPLQSEVDKAIYYV